MDLISTGRTATSREGMEALVSELQAMLQAQPQGTRMSLVALRRMLQEQSDVEVAVADLTDAVRQLAESNVVAFNERSRQVRVL